MEKQKYLFYWAEGLDLWVPVEEITPEFVNMTEELEHEEETALKFKVFEFTEDEYKNLPQY